ncbi:uncharacterized protein B0H18DRAFT_1012164 [Fomitopsis serialis]|uniref:uncharacterized protein n=1 Tax=Fomitopsis serialis TaxID=139415 RepID=UPI002007A608|nr:uncharacterized protein B0H18DRAFT_1012164 [Neoantrodia serialis]KAH9924435.1 hypothetical protein B0H18DRAFT_1012164 [Neoantrodia serialis]
MAAHRVLQSGDLLQQIFSHLDPHSSPWHNRSHCRGTLSSCARVNKALSTSAVSVLWRHMYSLLPLFKVLSSFQKVNIIGDDSDSDEAGGDLNARAQYVS